MTGPQAAEARRLAVAALLLALDGRHTDLPELLADADRGTLVVVVGGLAIAVGAALGEVHPDRRAALREGLADCALTMAGT